MDRQMFGDVFTLARGRFSRTWWHASMTLLASAPALILLALFGDLVFRHSGITLKPSIADQTSAGVNGVLPATHGHFSSGSALGLLLIALLAGAVLELAGSACVRSVLTPDEGIREHYGANVRNLGQRGVQDAVLLSGPLLAAGVTTLLLPVLGSVGVALEVLNVFLQLLVAPALVGLSMVDTAMDRAEYLPRHVWGMFRAQPVLVVSVVLVTTLVGTVVWLGSILTVVGLFISPFPIGAFACCVLVELYRALDPTPAQPATRVTPGTAAPAAVAASVPEPLVFEGVLAPGDSFGTWLRPDRPGEATFQLTWSDGPPLTLHTATSSGTWNDAGTLIAPHYAVCIPLPGGNQYAQVRCPAGGAHRSYRLAVWLPGQTAAA